MTKPIPKKSIEDLNEVRYSNDGTPYASVAAANAAILEADRDIGLTVNIANVEYWWKDVLTDVGLVVKQTTPVSEIDDDNVELDSTYSSQKIVNDFGVSGGGVTQPPSTTLDLSNSISTITLAGDLVVDTIENAPSASIRKYIHGGFSLSVLGKSDFVDRDGAYYVQVVNFGTFAIPSITLFDPVGGGGGGSDTAQQIIDKIATLLGTGWQFETIDPATALVATFNTPNVDLAWTTSSNATSYNIFGSLDGGAYTELANDIGDVVAWQHVSPASGVWSYYAIGTKGEYVSIPSNVDSVTVITATEKTMLINFGGGTLPSNVNNIPDGVPDVDKITSPVDSNEDAIGWNMDVVSWGVTSASTVSSAAQDYNDFVNIAMADASIRLNQSNLVGVINATGLVPNSSYKFGATGGRNSYDSSIEISAGGQSASWTMQNGRIAVSDDSFAEITLDSDANGEIEVTCTMSFTASTEAYLSAVRIIGPSN